MSKVYKIKPLEWSKNSISKTRLVKYEIYYTGLQYGIKAKIRLNAHSMSFTIGYRASISTAKRFAQTHYENLLKQHLEEVK